MPTTTPDVHRIHTAGAGGRQVTLGFVDTDGVYHFPGGRRVLANGDALNPDGTKTDSSCVVRSDGALAPNDQHAAAWPHGARHSVDMRYQAAYDADTDLPPAEVFAAVDDA
ncbi:MAG: hypothetical protein CME34_08400 [Gordonia sp.]|uniref:hypothetical protein n=1 Tax=Gordonia sp. (in: high G+C Gram-positive bacteria) TaxID=84139 RepID=UPI000C4AF12A|nr:hypothetical protein [Gordonia sp. (in: high G+C Gram-positive bacteria)]MAU81877.1 hypothetical protein [Gordonia sp. (in: high G+C Gram-positive bacteria)]